MQVLSVTPLVQSITNAKMVSTLHRIPCEKVHIAFRRDCASQPRLGSPGCGFGASYVAPSSPPQATFSLCLCCVACVTIRSIVLCTLGADTPLDAQREAPLYHQENVFSGTGIFQIVSGLCYDTRQFVTFYTILPYRPQCLVTVGSAATFLARSATGSDAAHKQA